MTDSVGEPAYLIIGGTTKAATTSVFSYLSGHPQVCGSTLKETRYFLDSSYPVRIPPSSRHEGREAYDRYFRDCPDRPVRVEATPDYLYSRPTPAALRRTLPEVRCVFILRDPVDRLSSWYRFAWQNGQIASTVSFEEYVRRQLYDECPDDSPQPWRVLTQGRYARYLRHYIDVLGRNAIDVQYFEYVVADPERCMKHVAQFAGVDPAFFTNYSFQVKNETRSVNNPLVHSLYRRAIRAVRYRVHRWPSVLKTFRRLRTWVDPVYYALVSTGDNPDLDLAPDLYDELVQYYAADASELEELIGQSPPWSRSSVARTS